MADLTISISLDASGLTSGVNAAQSKFESLKTNLASVGERMQVIGGQISGLGQSLTSSLTAPILSLAQMGMGLTAMKERAELSFSVLLDSGEKAKALMADLTNFADATPFESQEIIEAGKKLVSFGIEASEVKGILTDLGDTAATMDVKITDVAAAFGRLNAGDFGEAFERFRDFGISRELLEAQGLKFDKSGQYKGSVDEAMTAVRSVMQDKFGGTMDKLSNSVEGKLATLSDKAKGLLIKLFEPVQPALSNSLTELIKIVEQAVKWFEGAPDSVKIFILALAGVAAAIGPVLLAIGGVITAIGAFAASISAIIATGTVGVVIGAIAVAFGVLVAGIGVAIGVVYALREAWAAGFGPIASVVVIAIAAIIAAFSPVLGLPILIAAVAYTIYELWANNFGGLQEFTAQVWAKIQEYIAIAMAAIQQLVAEIGADMIAWWNENYPLIEQTVKTVSDAVKAYIEAWLKAITDFWNAHGEQIMSVVQSMWTIISNTVRTGIQVVMGIVRLVMQVINGDWAGAWETAKDIVSKVISAVGTILKEMHNIIFQALKFVVTYLVNWGVELFNKATEIGKNIVQGIINGISALAGKLADYGRSLVSGLLNSMSATAETRSPSLYTTRLGRYLGEGYIIGLDSMSEPMAATSVAVISNSLETMGNEGKEVAKKEVTKITAEVVKVSREGLGKMGKEAKKAVDEFEKVLNMKPQARQDMFTVSEFGTAKSQLETLIKLREELNQNVSEKLPTTLKAINEELEALGKQKAAAKEAADMLKQFDEQLAKLENKGKRETNVDRVGKLLGDKDKSRGITSGDQEELQRKARQLDDKIYQEQVDAARQKANAAFEVTRAQFQEEIDFLQKKKDLNYQMSAADQQKFLQDQKNAAEIKKMREEMAKDGIKPADIEASIDKLKEQQGAIQKLRDEKAQLEAQEKLYLDVSKGMDTTLEQLNQKLAANTKLTELNRIEVLLAKDAYAKLTQAQKDELIEKAKKIDEARKQTEEIEKAKKQMDEFKGFIKDSITTLVNDGFGAMFKGIVDKFKKMLIDMATEWIASKIFKLFFPDGKGSGSGGGGGAGNILSTIMGWLTGKKGSSGNAAGETGGTEGGTGGDAPKVSSFGGLFGPVKNVLNGKESALAGKMSGIGALATLAGSVIGGRVGGIISMAGTGMSIGANFGPWGAAIGAAAGALIGLFMGDPKKKIDKKENMPKLQKGFSDAMQQLRDLLADRGALFSDPDGAVAKAMEIRGQIAAGFGVEFQSKKYKKEAQKLIAAKLIEADGIIKQIKDLADVGRMAGKVDSRLEAEFASGVFADRAFIRQHRDFKRRNGMLAGQFTGRDTLPSMLAPGEMVLNPRQIERVKLNAGFDAFRGAGIPNYATGGYIDGSVTPATSLAPSGNQPINVQIVLNNSGIVESDIKGVLVNGLKSSDVQVELVKAYDKGKTRARG